MRAVSSWKVAMEKMEVPDSVCFQQKKAALMCGSRGRGKPASSKDCAEMAPVGHGYRILSSNHSLGRNEALSSDINSSFSLYHHAKEADWVGTGHEMMELTCLAWALQDSQNEA